MRTHLPSSDLVDDHGAALVPTEEVAAGGALFFHDLTLHASHTHRATVDVWMWLARYGVPIAGEDT